MDTVLLIAASFGIVGFVAFIVGLIVAISEPRSAFWTRVEKLGAWGMKEMLIGLIIFAGWGLVQIWS